MKTEKKEEKSSLCIFFSNFFSSRMRTRSNVLFLPGKDHSLFQTFSKDSSQTFSSTARVTKPINIDTQNLRIARDPRDGAQFPHSTEGVCV